MSFASYLKDSALTLQEKVDVSDIDVWYVIYPCILLDQILEYTLVHSKKLYTSKRKEKGEILL